VIILSDCIFCKIIKGDIPGNFVYQDDKVVAFNDIDPKAPVHILIVPKEHIPSLMEAAEDKHDILSHILMVATKLAKETGIDQKGFRIVNNCGEEGGQSVGHIHFHLLGGRFMQWPPG
jgi:histidine triad (HIT) family protein